MTKSKSKIAVLLTNDDGPPSDAHSAFIWSFYRCLTDELGWDVKVVIPSSQKSWIGKAFHISEITTGQFYYPRDPDGLGETSPTSRPLKEGEFAEWILLDGTPATCANVALHNIYPNQIDLVISGPNVGRNTSSAFALSSGTLGAALSSSLTGLRSLALSYGIVQHQPPPATYLPQANALAVRIIRRLWREWGCDPRGLRPQSGEGEGGGEVDLYSINIPLVPSLNSEGEDEGNGMGVLWTTMWRNKYGRLFKTLPPSHPSTSASASPSIPPEGPDLAHPTTTPSPPSSSPPSSLSPASPQHRTLQFKFSPDMTHLIPSPTGQLAGTTVHPARGTDAWAIHNGYASVTPLRASFAEPDVDVLGHFSNAGVIGGEGGGEGGDGGSGGGDNSGEGELRVWKWDETYTHKEKL